MSAAIEESDSGLVSDNVNTFAVGGKQERSALCGVVVISHII